MTTTVITIDDHPLFRKGVSQLLEMDSEFNLIGEAASGIEGIDLAKELNPDIILLDLNMSGMNGIQTLAKLKESKIDSHVIMLTVSDDEKDLVLAIRNGADGYLLKDMEPEQTLEMLHKAIKGEMIISPRLTTLLAKAIKDDNQTPQTILSAGLTEREGEILRILATGASNKIIARKLDIVESTVKVHVKHILKKLNLKSRVEAAIWATNNL